MKVDCKTNEFRSRKVLRMQHTVVRVLVCWLLLFGFSHEMRSQEWLPPNIFTGTGRVSVNFVRALSSGHRLIGGSFDQQFGQFQSAGETDFFIGLLDESGVAAYWRQGGGLLQDELKGLSVDGAGHYYAGGTFWGEMIYGTDSLQALYNPKAIFVVKNSLSGTVVWTQVLSGTGLKELAGLETDADGHLYVAGYFSDSLFFPGADVIVAEGQSDMFVAKLSSSGSLMWVQTAGQAGDTRATALALDASGRVYVTGYFNETSAFGTTLLTANTADKDVFTVAYDASGEIRWVRQAGGVHDDDATAMVVDESGQIYIGGYFVGVIQAGNQVLSSQNGFPDVFVLKYNQAGEAQGGWSGGGLTAEVINGLALSDEGLLLWGYYQGTLIMDAYSRVSGGVFRGYYAVMDKESLQVMTLEDIPASGSSFIQDMREESAGRIVMVGTALGEVQFLDGSAVSYPQFGGFLAVSSVLPSRDADPLVVEGPRYGIFPNPGSGLYEIVGMGDAAEVACYDQIGRRVEVLRQGVRLDMRHLAPGMYVVVIKEGLRQGWVKIVHGG
jgi:hypothetical protein